MNKSNLSNVSLHLDFVDHLNRIPVLIVVLVVGVTVSTFNIITIAIILRSKKLRRPFNFPIINILLAATLQSFFTVPAYAFKRLDKGISHHQEAWICNIYRFPYFLCGDILRLSFMLVSFDRLIAVKCAYFYKKFVTKNVYITVLLMIWVLVLAVDSLPFFPLGKVVDKEQCTYVLEHMWGICVTMAFNIIPFIVTLINFFILWRIASKITVKTHSIRKEILRVKENEDSVLHKKLEGFVMQRVLDVEISRRHYDANGRSVFNRRTSYMYAMKGAKDQQINIPDVELDLDSSSTDNVCTSCYPLSEKLLLILEMRATKSSALLLLVYMVCWTPLGIYHFIENICSTWISGIQHKHAYIDQFVLKVLSLFSSVFLPLVYCWRTKMFRGEALRLSTRITARVKDIPVKYKQRFQKCA